MSDLLAIDIECDGDPWTGRLLCVAWSYDGRSSKVEVEPSPTLLELLADPEVTKVEHSKFDARWLTLAGHEVNGPIIDTMTMAWALDENQPLDLEALALRYLSLKMDKRVSRNKNVVRFRRDDGRYCPIGDAPLGQLQDYCLRDVAALVLLHDELKRRLESSPDLYKAWKTVDQPFTRVLLDTEVAGMPVDVAEAGLLRDSLSIERDRLRVSLIKRAELPPTFNLNSPDQVAAYLFLSGFDLPGRVLIGDPIPDDFTVTKTGRLWQSGTYHVEGRAFIPQKRWTKSGHRPKCDNATLAVHYGGDSWVQKYLEYKELDKLIGTYLEPIVEQAHGGRLYGKFNQTGTVTGRLSSSEPNLQNIPSRGEWGAKIRGLFKGDFIIGDFGQLEPRLMSHFSQDPSLLRVFREGLDVYRILGQDVFQVEYNDVTPQQRDTCKELLLAMGYGAMARKISERISLQGYHTTVQEAQQYLDRLIEAYPVFWEWKEKIVTGAEDTGYVYTIAGRARSLAGKVDNEDWNTKTHGERQAVNSVIQGSAADIVKATMLEARRVYPQLPLLCQVHDEVIFEVMDCGEHNRSTSAGRQGSCSLCAYESEDALIAGLQEIGENPPWELSVPLVFRPKRVIRWSDK